MKTKELNRIVRKQFEDTKECAWWVSEKNLHQVLSKSKVWKSQIM